MAASPLVQGNTALLDKNYPKSPAQLDSISSPNQLNQPRLDVEPNQPLFNKNELGRSDMLSSNLGSPSSDPSKLLQTAMRVKDQNNKLKVQLKELKQTLKDTLIKVQTKNKVNEEAADPKESVLNKELDEHQRQIAVFKKEISAIKNRLEGLQSQERVVKMENLLKEKNRLIDNMAAEKRNLEKIKSNQDQELDKFQKEFGYEKRIASFNDEARQIREKIKKTQTINKQNERVFKTQQEYLVLLSNQYRMVCDKLGVAPSMNFTRAEELTNIITTKQKEAKAKMDEIASFKTTVASQRKMEKSKSTKESKELKNAKDTKPLEPTQANINKLQQSIETLKINTDNLEKDYAKEIAAAEAEKKAALAKLNELKGRLKDKEKEASILAHRAQELKRIVRFNAVKPLGGEGLSD